MRLRRLFPLAALLAAPLAHAQEASHSCDTLSPCVCYDHSTTYLECLTPKLCAQTCEGHGGPLDNPGAAGGGSAANTGSGYSGSQTPVLNGPGANTGANPTGNSSAANTASGQAATNNPAQVGQPASTSPNAPANPAQVGEPAPSNPSQTPANATANPAQVAQPTTTNGSAPQNPAQVGQPAPSPGTGAAPAAGAGGAAAPGGR